MINLHVLSFVKTTRTIEEPSVFGAGTGELKRGSKVNDGTHSAFPMGLARAQPGIL